MSNTTSRANEISIGELSRRTGVNIETIRYYERSGVIPRPPRTSGGRRTYDETFVKRLSFVSRSRQLGFSLDEIRSLLGLVDEHEYTCADVRELCLASFLPWKEIASTRRWRCPKAYPLK